MDGPVLFDIVLVEKSDVDAELMLGLFQRHKLANSVVRARNADEALDFVMGRGAYASRGTKSLGLMLLDLNLPEADGIKVVMAVKTERRTQSLPIVVLTASAQQRDKVESYRLGVDGYLVKPVQFTDVAGLFAGMGFSWGVFRQRPDQGADRIGR